MNFKLGCGHHEGKKYDLKATSGEKNRSRIVPAHAPVIAPRFCYAPAPYYDQDGQQVVAAALRLAEVVDIC
ncbi:MAG TPA: hypothetical protein VHU19_08780 [Pyrinomonadaceae bacterium]|jgi:hypothetical protein|nr:hypothetical protein [Pyrinomonadaceae bacterium]